MIDAAELSRLRANASNGYRASWDDVIALIAALAAERTKVEEWEQQTHSWEAEASRVKTERDAELAKLRAIADLARDAAEQLGNTRERAALDRIAALAETKPEGDGE